MSNRQSFHLRQPGTCAQHIWRSTANTNNMILQDWSGARAFALIDSPLKVKLFMSRDCKNAVLFRPSRGVRVGSLWSCFRWTRMNKLKSINTVYDICATGGGIMNVTLPRHPDCSRPNASRCVPQTHSSWLLPLYTLARCIIGLISCE